MKHITPYTLYESKYIGNLYHTTKIGSLSLMLTMGCIRASSDAIERNFLSTSRNHRFLYKQDVKMVLDGFKISQNYKIKPVHFFNTVDKQYGLEHRTQGESMYNQSEERVLLTKEGQLPLNPYLIRVIINTSVVSAEKYEPVLQKLKFLNIPFILLDEKALANHK